MSELNYKGLEVSEIEKLRQKFGFNSVEAKQENNLFLQILKNFKSPIILILLGASFLSIILGETRDALIIVLMVFLSIILDFVQEFRANNAASKLASKLNKFCTVVRGSKKYEIRIEELVPGDIIFLNIGDIVPADASILEFDSFEINESVLTGESFPIEKKISDCIYAGSEVTAGLAYAKVENIGLSTKFGKIAKTIAKKQERNSFEQGIDKFGNLIIKVTFLIVTSVIIIILTKGFFTGRNFDLSYLLEIFLFAITIAVGLTPELLPVITSLNLARGSLKMNKKGVLVKKLDAIPDFGSMDILCTDKTGTLTEDKITLVKHLDVHGIESNRVLEMGFYNSYFQSGLKNPLDEAVLAHESIDTKKFIKIDEIPYDFHRRSLSVVLQDQAQIKYIYTKGQPEEIFKICTSIENKFDDIKHLDSTKLSEITEIYHDLSRQGYRVLAVCYRKTDIKEIDYNVKSEKEMILIGLLAFLDPPKMSAKIALELMEKYGIKIKILTGDNELVTAKVCQELDIQDYGIITGESLNNYSDDEFSKIVEQKNIFARVNPEQKQKIINILKQNGHVVGYMGDGINDAPSLRASDVGISVENAVDIAKESADIILTEKNLESLVEGVIEGRKTFGNTQKYMFMALSSNFGNMLSMIAAVMFLPFLPMLPTQILFNNLLYDISQVGIPLDWVDEEYILKPKKWDIGFIQKFMLAFGPISSLFDVLTFFIMFKVLGLQESSFQTAWFIESLATQILVIFIIRTRLTPFIQSKPGKYLTLSAISMLSTGVIVALSPLGLYFGFGSLTIQAIFVIIALVISYLLLVEFIKKKFYKKYAQIY